MLLGPVVGAVLYIYAQGEFAETGNLQLYTGLAMIIAVVFLPGGITGFGATLYRRVRGACSGGQESEPVLEAPGVTLRYGAVVAVDDVDIAVEPGVLHGVIGPNGAGKSSFMDALSGRRRLSAGKVVLDGEDITKRRCLAPAARDGALVPAAPASSAR